jgi:small conductance mechanosensitive channel
MDTEIEKFRKLGENIMNYGQEVLLALFILVAGLILIRFFVRYLKRLLQRFISNPALVSTISSAVHVVLIIVIVMAASYDIGIPMIIIRRIFVAGILIGVGLIVLFRPFLPSLPYKIGNTVKMGGLLGKVEATTILNTRLKTFDGKTLFIPNRMILNDIVENYHLTPTRQIRLGVWISYGDDLLKAKEILKTILKEEPRITEKPAPVVYVTNLGDNGVELSARGWVENAKYWKARCELLETIKLRFDQEGITIPFPQRHVHFDGKASLERGDEPRPIHDGHASDPSEQEAG